MRLVLCAVAAFLGCIAALYLFFEGSLVYDGFVKIVDFVLDLANLVIR